MNKSTDIIGLALENYYFHGKDIPIIIHSPEFDEDEIAPSWYFRSFKEMPDLEKIALKYCKAKVLDIGAGAGSHSLYLQEKGMDVSSIDLSEGACRVMKDRGLKKVFHEDLFQFQSGKYDSILMMMNGIGVCGTLDGLDMFLSKLDGLLNPGGQLIMDSSNLSYLFGEEERDIQTNSSKKYYGEIEFQMEYLDIMADPFSWLFVHFEELSRHAAIFNFKSKILYKGDNLHFLARIFR